MMPGRRNATKFGLLGAGALVALSAACGSDDAASGATVTTDATVTIDSTVVIDVSELPEGRGVVAVNDDGTRTVTSSYGTAIVPAQPQRIVSVIGDVDFEAMLALGVRPVGAGTQGGTVESGFAPHLSGLVDGIEPLAWSDGSPTEAIAALDPDLIFVPDSDTAALLDDIAPTVPRGSWVGTDWKADFLYVGEVIGKADEAAVLLARYDGDVADMRARLAPIIEGKSVLSPQVGWDHSNVYVDADESFSGAVLTELGFELAPLAFDDNPDGVGVSWEELERLDADYLFWQVRQADDGSPDVEALDIVQSNPLYASLPAVEAGQVFEVPNRPWYFPTILGAQQILDDVRASLLAGGR